MHLTIAQFPAVPAERDDDFRDWFGWSNEQLVRAGLIRRRLLRAPDGAYTSLVDYDNLSTFAATPMAEAVSLIHRGLGPILNDAPHALRYDIVVDSLTAETRCEHCNGTGRREDTYHP